jgi:O-antigen ligase
LLNPENKLKKLESIFLTLFFILLPTQFGKHFWPDFSFVSGIMVDYLSPTIYVTDVVVGMLFVCVLVRIALQKEWWEGRECREGRIIIRPYKQYWYVFIILSFLIFSALSSPRPMLGFYEVFKWGEMGFLAFYLARRIKKQGQLQKIAFLFAVSALFESLLAIVQYVHQGSLNGVFYFFGERMFTGATPGIANVSIAGDLILRSYGTFPHPNVLAGYLLVSMIFIWGFLHKSPRKLLRMISFVSLFFCSIALFLTFSRVVILLGIVLGCVVVVKKMISVGANNYSPFAFRKRLIHSFMIICLFGFIAFCIFRFIPFSHEVLVRFTQTSLTEESITQRESLVQAAMLMMQQRPLVGVGIGNFIPSLVPLQQPKALGFNLQPVHNIYLLVTAEMGLVGLGLFGWLLISTYSRLRRQGKDSHYVIGTALGVILITGLFDHYWLTLQQGQLLFAVVVGLGMIRKRL